MIQIQRSEDQASSNDSNQDEDYVYPEDTEDVQNDLYIYNEVQQLEQVLNFVVNIKIIMNIFCIFRVNIILILILIRIIGGGLILAPLDLNH